MASQAKNSITNVTDAMASAAQHSTSCFDRVLVIMAGGHLLAFLSVAKVHVLGGYPQYRETGIF